MRLRARPVVAAAIVLPGALAGVSPAWAQTGGLDSPTVWLLVASLAQIVGAAAVVVFFITRGRPRRCPRCGQRLGRDEASCRRCGGAPGDFGRRPRRAAE